MNWQRTNLCTPRTDKEKRLHLSNVMWRTLLDGFPNKTLLIMLLRQWTPSHLAARNDGRMSEDTDVDWKSDVDVVVVLF